MLIFFFLFGLAVGSFLNSVIFRLDLPAGKAGKQESVVKHRSYCPYCKQTLAWFELIPLVSFILQKGKCRHCKKPISWQYPLVELATGILFALCGWYFFPNILNSIFYILASGFLIIIFVYDLKHYIIPDQVVYPAIIIAFLYRLFGILNFGNWDLFRILDLGFGILPTLFFAAIVLFSHGRWMGIGDIKLVLFMGLILGWPKIFVALFLAFLIGALASLILIAFKRKTLKSEIPFGPFLAGATIITMFLGDILLNWYLNLFLI